MPFGVGSSRQTAWSLSVAERTCGHVARRRGRWYLVPCTLGFALALMACGDSSPRTSVAHAGGLSASPQPSNAPATPPVAGPVAAPAAAPVTMSPSHFGLGRRASPRELAAIDIDVNGAGVGLPPGGGTHDEGATLYRGRCASCHGASGEGRGSYPQLIGAPADSSFRFGIDPSLPKTVGNYWPYATTLYDYVHRAMPLNAPGSLRPAEVYSLVAFLLAENHVISRAAVMDAHTLPAVRMPARGHFVPDDRTGGPIIR